MYNRRVLLRQRKRGQKREQRRSQPFSRRNHAVFLYSFRKEHRMDERDAIPL